MKENTGREGWASVILALWDKSDEDGGVFLKDVGIGQVIEVHTKDAIYQMVVVDKESDFVAVTSDGEHIAQPEVWCLIGSTWGTAVIKRGFVGVNMRLEMQMADSRRTLISMNVDTIKIWENRRQAAVLVAAAKENRRRKTPLPQRFFRWCSKLFGK